MVTLIGPPQCAHGPFACGASAPQTEHLMIRSDISSKPFGLCTPATRRRKDSLVSDKVACPRTRRRPERSHYTTDLDLYSLVRNVSLARVSKRSYHPVHLWLSLHNFPPPVTRSTSPHLQVGHSIRRARFSNSDSVAPSTPQTSHCASVRADAPSRARRRIPEGPSASSQVPY